jgi:hypothetical protein
METRTLRLRIERADETVRRAVFGLMRLRGFTVETVADAVGIPLETLERRLRASGSAHGFTAGEVLALTDYFGIEGETLFHYMDGQYRPPHDWTPARALRAPAGSGAIRPSEDSRTDSGVDHAHAQVEAEIAIGRAQGVLMEALRASSAEALTRMRAYAHRHGVSVLDVATAILASGTLTSWSDL